MEELCDKFQIGKSSGRIERSWQKVLEIMNFTSDSFQLECKAHEKLLSNSARKDAGSQSQWNATQRFHYSPRRPLETFWKNVWQNVTAKIYCGECISKKFAENAPGLQKVSEEGTQLQKNASGSR